MSLTSKLSTSLRRRKVLASFFAASAAAVAPIEAVDLGPLSDPLLYWPGGYHTINDLSPFLFSETV